MNPPTSSASIVDPKAGVTDPTAAKTSGDAAISQISCVYFGYGSNLSPRTMKQRCPDSLFIGLAVLKDWKWMINETGYANIVPSPGDEVYGSLCFLSGRDEAALDDSEGVPWLYEKKYLKLRRMVKEEEEAEWGEGPELEAMSYVDVQRITEGQIQKEYVTWVDKAIVDGVECSMPQSYADKYLVPYLPPDRGRNMPDVVMVRTSRFGPGDYVVPKGFASWSRG